MSDTVEWEPRECFEVLVLAGMQFHIDDEARRDIERFLARNPTSYQSITIEDIHGAPVLVIADAVNSIYSTTPETRERTRRMTASLDREEGVI